MIILIISLAMVLLFTPASSAIGISHGTPAPDFTLRTVEGKSISLGEYKDKVVVIIFWRTGQKRSLLALKDSMDILKRYRKRGMELLGIIEDSDDREEAVMVFKDNNFTFPLLMDRDRQVYGEYGVRVSPSTIIINREGVLVYDIPSHPLTYKTKLRGYIKKSLGEIDEKELNEALSPHNYTKDKSSLEAARLYNLALRFTETRMFDLAINSAVKSLTAAPDMVQSHILLGFLYLETEEEDKALEAFNRALEIAPDSHDAKTGLGGALLMKGEIERAVGILESAAIANPYPQMTYYELGRAYEMTGETDKAMDMYKKAIEKIISKKILPSSVSRCN